MIALLVLMAALAIPAGVVSYGYVHAAGVDEDGPLTWRIAGLYLAIFLAVDVTAALALWLALGS